MTIVFVNIGVERYTIRFSFVSKKIGTALSVEHRCHIPAIFPVERSGK